VPDKIFVVVMVVARLKREQKVRRNIKLLGSARQCAGVATLHWSHTCVDALVIERSQNLLSRVNGLVDVAKNSDGESLCF